MKNNNPEILNLLEQFNYLKFSELPEISQFEIKEKGFSEKDYEQVRQIILKSSDLMKSEAFAPTRNILGELHRNISEAPKQGLIYKIINFKMPAYATAAIVILALSAGLILRQKETIEKVVYKDKPVVVEKIVYKEKPVIIEKKIYIKTESQPMHEINLASSSVSDKSNVARMRAIAYHAPNKFVGVENLKLLLMQKKGKNLTEDSIIKNFMFSIN